MTYCCHTITISSETQNEMKEKKREKICIDFITSGQRDRQTDQHTSILAEYNVCNVFVVLCIVYCIKLYCICIVWYNQIPLSLASPNQHYTVHVWMVWYDVALYSIFIVSAYSFWKIYKGIF